MRKTIFFISALLIAVIFCSCGTESDHKKIETQSNLDVKVSFNLDAYVRLTEIDSCEYLIATRSDAISIIHKQNCKFCTERNKN